MVIGVCIIEINLPGVTSLKEKRSRLKSLKNRISRDFNVSVAEIALHDAWQSASVGVVVVSTAPSHAEAVLEGVVRWIETYRPDLEIVVHEIEVETW